MFSSKHLWLAAAAFAAGCGGKAVVEMDEGAGGAGGTGPSTTTSATTTTATTSTTSATTSTSTSSTTTSSVTTTTTGAGGAPPIPPLVEVDYGALAPGDLVGFDAQPGILGFTAVQTAVNAANSFDLFGIESTTSPSGTAVTSDYTIPGTYATFYNYGSALLAVPQTDVPEAMPPMSGKWTLKPDTVPASHMSVWYRQTLDGAFHGGVIDVNVFIADDIVDQNFALFSLQNAFGSFVGLTLGNVNFFKLGPEWLDIDENNFYQLFEQTAGAPGKPALNVMMVGFLSGQLEGAAGVTPAAPSNPLDHGTHLSGVVVTLFGDDTIDSVILRHETGHFAGLLHTSEFDAGVGDALSDTPFCPDVNNFMEQCPDYNNLMFPTGGDFSMTLSARQQKVMQASTLYRGIVEPGGAPAAPLAIQVGGGGSGALWARPAAFRRPSLPSAGPPVWQNHLPSTLPAAAARYMAGLWCGGPSRGLQVDPYKRLQQLGATDAGALIDLAMNGAAPLHVRRRALAAAGHLRTDSAQRARMVAIGADLAMPRQVRLGAFEGLRKASPEALRELAVQLAAQGDRPLRHLAERHLP